VWYASNRLAARDSIVVGVAQLVWWMLHRSGVIPTGGWIAHDLVALTGMMTMMLAVISRAERYARALRRAKEGR
jgi:hypothetical protein